jgi:hypothetical protein
VFNRTVLRLLAPALAAAVGRRLLLLHQAWQVELVMVDSEKIDVVGQQKPAFTRGSLQGYFVIGLLLGSLLEVTTSMPRGAVLLQ